MDAGALDHTTPHRDRLAEVAGLFLKLGLIAFGGPAAHIAMMREEAVRRRHWVSDPQFLDLLGASNLIPGPTSTELAIYLGYTRAGWQGLVLAGVCFILPAMLLVLALAWAYVRYGATPQAAWMLYGIKPAIIAIVVQAIWGLARTAVKTPVLAALGGAVVVLYLLGVNVIVLLFGAGVIMIGAQVGGLGRGRTRLAAVAPLRDLAAAGVRPLASGGAVPLTTLFFTFMKIGAVVYGSGYVLLAFLRQDLVDRLHWLTDRQLIDAVIAGQFTPGPVFTTATFIGYLTGGIPGALLATLGIFLPSFLFVALVSPLLPRLRTSAWTGAFLDGANVAAVGLMAAVTWQLSQAAIVDGLTLGLAVVASAALFRLHLNSAWLVLGGAVMGVGFHMLPR